MTQSRHTRRVTAALSAALLVGSLAACGGSADSASSSKTLKLAVQEPYSAFFFHVAQEEGYLAEAGLDGFEAKTFTTPPAMQTAVAQGAMDAGVQVLPALVAYNAEASTDAQLKMFDVYGVDGIYWAAASDSGLPEVQDGDWQSVVRSWKGKKVGVVALGGVLEQYVRYMAAEAGLNPDKDFEIIATGGGPAAVAALQQGLVDVAGGSSSILALVEGQDAGYPIMRITDGPEELQGVISSGFFASASQIEERPDYYEEIYDALEKARDFAADPANEEEVVSILTDSVGLEESVAQAVYDLDQGSGTYNGALDQATYEQSINALVTTKMLPPDAPGFDALVAADIVGSN
jgi:NitT/TauT family transport system substrate-binding protein